MNQKFVSDKDLSRRNWGDKCETDVSGDPVYKFNAESVARGLAQRNADALETIAKSTEAMAQNYLSLQEDVERYKRWHNNQKSLKEEAERSVRALKGVVTKQKNRIKELEAKLKAASASQNVPDATNG